MLNNKIIKYFLRAKIIVDVRRSIYPHRFSSTKIVDPYNLYLEKAQSILSTESLDKNVIRLALELIKNENEKERELLKKDMDRELLKIENEKEKELLKINHGFELLKSESYYKNLLSEISQRELLDKLFGQVASLVKAKNKHPKILRAIESFPEKTREKLENTCKAVFPVASLINRCLKENEELKRAVWEEVGLKEDIVLPDFKNEQLYPIMSSFAHSLGIKKMFLSSDADESLKTFLINLAEIYKRQVDIYDSGISVIPNIDH